MIEMPLNNSQSRYLRGLCHRLKPVVMVADKGLSENVMAEIELALEHHELIKLKLRGDREQRKLWLQTINSKFSATLVHNIGQVACLYRRNNKNPKIALPT